MHRTLSLLLAAAALAVRVAAAEPSAHDPHYDTSGLWPEDVKTAAYAQQKWEPARLLVWAKTGTFGGKVSDPANWLEDGKPAAKGPDEHTDLLFPDQAKATRVESPTTPLEGRHITVGSGILLKVQHVWTTGNVWVRPNGSLNCRTFRCKGGTHTFMRSDSTGRLMAQTKNNNVNKENGATLELLGNWQTADWFQIDRGSLIVGPGAYYGGGNRHQNVVGPEGTLIVLSGATFTTWKVKPWAYDLDLHGKLLIGTPERPLTRDVQFLLNPKPRTTGGRCGPMDRSLQTRPGSSIAVHSADPAKARLVVRLRPRDAADAAPEEEDDELGPAPTAAESGGEGKLDFRLLGELRFAGVVFEDVAAGGIQVPDPSAAQKAWTQVAFGKGCAAPDALFAVATAAQNANGEVLSNPQLTPKKK